MHIFKTFEIGMLLNLLRIEKQLYVGLSVKLTQINLLSNFTLCNLSKVKKCNES